MNLGTRGWRVILSVAIVVLMSASFARADLAGAQKALDDAKKNVADQDWNNADTNVKLAETELDGVADADKKPIQDQLDAIKKQIADTQANAGKAAIIKQADDILADAKKYLTEQPDPEAVLRDSDQLDEFLKKDDTKAVLSADDIAKYRDQMAKYKKVAAAKQGDKDVENVDREYQRLKDSYATRMAAIKGPGEPGSHDDDVNTLGRDLDIFSKHLAALPQDNDKVKTMQAAYTQMNAAFGAVANSAQAVTVLRTLKDSWDINPDEYKGWEAEGNPPTFEQYSKASSEAMSAFNMPKSKVLISRSEQFLDNRQNDNDYKAVATTPEVKAFIDSIKKMHDDAYAKMLKAATSVVEGAEKTTIDRNNKNAVDRLKDDVRLALGDKSPDTAALQARVAKLAGGFDAATAGAEQAKLDAYKTLKDKATQDWPAMEAKFSPQSGFDPTKYSDWKGKVIKITTDNLMGYRFQPGDFPFATTLSGNPVACKYSPAVKAAIDDVEKQIGRGIGDSDDDGKWEIIAVVNGTMGKMQQRKQVEGDVKTTDGEKVGTIKSEYSEPVDAPIITIIAAHCGPLAVASDSAEASAAGSSASGGGSWMRRILFLIIGLAAAGACLIKAHFAPLAAVPQVGEVETRIGGTNLAYIGFVCALYGLFSLLAGYIIFGLLVNLAIIAAGLYAGLDWLTAKGFVKPDQAAKIRPLGVPIGLACAVLVVLELIVQGRLYIL